jgi:hypothetical protein
VIEQYPFIPDLPYPERVADPSTKDYLVRLWDALRAFLAGRVEEHGYGCLWAREDADPDNIYNKNYADGCVGIGTNTTNDSYWCHVEGDLLIRSRADGEAIWSDVVGKE